MSGGSARPWKPPLKRRCPARRGAGSPSPTATSRSSERLRGCLPAGQVGDDVDRLARAPAGPGSFDGRVGGRGQCGLRPRPAAGDRAGRLLLWAPGETPRWRRPRTPTRAGGRSLSPPVDTSGAVGVIVRERTVVEVWDLKRCRSQHTLTCDNGAPACARVAVSGKGRYASPRDTELIPMVWRPSSTAYVPPRRSG